MEEKSKKKLQEAISIMKKAYDTYRFNALRSLENDLSEDYWHWTGIAEGTRRSWELLEELFEDLNTKEETNNGM